MHILLFVHIEAPNIYIFVEKKAVFRSYFLFDSDYIIMNAKPRLYSVQLIGSF